MSEDFPKCRIADSGWRPDARGEPTLQTHGAFLGVELRAWTEGERLDVAGSLTSSEELGAVLEGRFELVCGEERYELKAGDGILVPPREGHSWRVLSERGVLYRVIGPPVT